MNRFPLILTAAQYMRVYTIREKPADYPDDWIITLDLIMQDGRIVRAGGPVKAEGLDDARRIIQEEYPDLTCFPRMPEDHPSVREVWL